MNVLAFSFCEQKPTHYISLKRALWGNKEVPYIQELSSTSPISLTAETNNFTLVMTISVRQTNCEKMCHESQQEIQPFDGKF